MPIAATFWLLSAPLDPFLPSALVLGLIVTSEARDQAQALQMTFLIGYPNVLPASSSRVAHAPTM